MNNLIISYYGRAIAQAVSPRLLTAAARIRARSNGGQNNARAGFLRVLRFPQPIFITQNSPSSLSPGAGTIGQKWPMCRVDPVWTPPSPKRIKKKLLKVNLLHLLTYSRS
jgi:hypothetical protein